MLIVCCPIDPDAYAEEINRREIRLTTYTGHSFTLSKKGTMRAIECAINARSNSEHSMNGMEYEWLYLLLKW